MTPSISIILAIVVLYGLAALIDRLILSRLLSGKATSRLCSLVIAAAVFPALSALFAAWHDRVDGIGIYLLMGFGLLLFLLLAANIPYFLKLRRARKDAAVRSVDTFS